MFIIERVMVRNFAYLLFPLYIFSNLTIVSVNLPIFKKNQCRDGDRLARVYFIGINNN
jgi:hypothetical protein